MDRLDRAPSGDPRAAPPAETERSFPAPAGPLWRAEPFRLFFPLAVVLGWVGIGHWLLYALGVTATYSCRSHGLVQTQAFMMAFAVGFLLTAIPRRTRAAAPTPGEMTAIAAALILTTAAAISERWLATQLSYGACFAILLRFALRRLLGATAARRPPAAFVLIPIGAAHGIAGAALLALAALDRGPAYALGLGTLLVEQGVFLCFVVGVGSLVLPLMAGAPPPADLGSAPGERWKACAYAAAGVAIFSSLVLEHAGWLRAGPLLRAGIVAAGLAVGGGAWHPPGKPGLHRRLVWLAVWLIPLGLALAGILPDYRVPALHVLFIGGFGLLAFGVATHVTLGHLGLEALALGRPPAVVVLGTTLLLATAARFVADWSDSYFAHLGWAAGLWIVGSATWLGFVAFAVLDPRPATSELRILD